MNRIITNLQLGLEFGRLGKHAKAVISQEDITALLFELGNGEWHTGEQLRTAIGWGERKLRDVAEASNGQVLSAPGCALGYKLAVYTPVEEYYAEIRRRYQSQIKRMEERLIKMDKAVHAAGSGVGVG